VKNVTVGKIASLNSIELSYIAGFLDGDGSVMALVEKHEEKRYGIRIRIVAEFTQHDDQRRVLNYLQNKIGGGSIHRSLRNVWKYSIKDQQLVRELLDAFSPYTVLKKSQMRLALRILSLFPITDRRVLIKTAKLADVISGKNLRSKSRRINGLTLVQEAISRND